jgi:Tol biopolymer transport system component
MSRKPTLLIVIAVAMLTACSPSPPADRPAIADRRQQPVVSTGLPTADTGAIDLALLHGRFVFGAGGNSLESTEVYTARADGTGVTRLTNNRIPDFDPSWSPDGSEIVFRRHLGENAEIFAMRCDGSDVRNLTHEPAVDWGPEWSPDGQWIAFNSGRDSSSDLHGFVIAPDGKELRRLSQDVFIEYPTWSPDGKRIAFMSQTWNGAGGNYEIFVMNADGSRVRQLTDVPGDDGWPAWSPDGSKIAFTSLRDDCAFTDRAGCKDFDDVGEFHTLYVMDADGSNQTRVTDVFGQFAVWSPDGEYIAFTPAPGGIYVMRPDGSDLTLIEIESLPADIQMPDWVA